MRVLLSGMTRMQVNGNRRRMYNTSINALYHAMKFARHDVEWRPIEYGEKGLEKKFDLIILGLGTISEYSCQYLYHALLASQADNVLYLVNDWKANKTIHMLRDEDLFREFVMNNNTGSRVSATRIRQDRKLLEKCREKMFRRKDNIMGPFFSWGDRQIILRDTPFESIHEFDPSAFYLKHWSHVNVAERKTRQWVYGALDSYAKWHERLGLKWPVHAFNKKTFIPEDELIKLCAKSHGMLMPKYRASGSGWWRARYCHGIICHNVMYADPKEWGELKHTLAVPLKFIEDATGEQLNEIAQMQRKTLLKQMSSWNGMVDMVDNVLQEVTA